MRSVWSMIRHPRTAIKEQVESVELKLAEAEKQLREDLRHRLSVILVRAALGVAAAVLGLVAGVYFLIGLWLALDKFWGPIAASFTLAALFGLAAMVPAIALYTIIREGKDQPQQQTLI